MPTTQSHHSQTQALQLLFKMFTSPMHSPTLLLVESCLGPQLLHQFLSVILRLFVQDAFPCPWVNSWTWTPLGLIVRLMVRFFVGRAGLDLPGPCWSAEPVLSLQFCATVAAKRVCKPMGTESSSFRFMSLRRQASFRVCIKSFQRTLFRLLKLLIQC